MLKESYQLIGFPLEKKDPSTLLDLYLREFEVANLENYSNLLLIFTHGLRDYLAGKIDEDAFGSLSFSLFTDKKVQKYLRKRNSRLYSLLLDCLDISWLSDGVYFGEFKKQLELNLTELQNELT